MARFTLRLALGLACLSLTAFAGTAADVIEGRVVAVADGDTLTVLDAKKVQHKIRLEGIDAPESGQAFGTQAKKALSERVFGKDVKVNRTGEDRYGRTLGHVYLDDRWINHELVEAGFAWHFKKYSKDEKLAAAEVTAREKGAGLWRDKDLVAPWDYRRLQADPKAKPQPPPEAAGGETVYVTKAGEKYHREGCKSLSKSKLPISLEEARRRYVPCKICKPST